jgi:selenocysteine lyase/cysteine desulfurase
MSETELNNRRGFLKTSALSMLSLIGISQTKLMAQGVDFSNFKTLTDDDLFSQIRSELVIPANRVYLNTGTLGPTPKFIIDKVTELTNRLEANPAGENFGPMGQEMEVTRSKAAKFINADLEEIILTRNTTEGISIVCSAIDWKAGDEILTTNHEHGGAETGLDFLNATKGAVIKKIQMPYPVQNKKQILDLVKAHITEKTKLLLLSHVETVTGLRMPIKEISDIARSKAIMFIVDGAQAPGMININVQDLGCDVYAFSGHKWVMGPKETGIVFIRKSIQEKINNVFLTGGYSSYSRSSGTRNAPNIIGFGDIMDWHEKIGKDRIEKRCLDLARYCQDNLKNIKGLKVITTDVPGLSTAIVSVSLDNVSNREVYNRMREKDIIVKTLPQYNALRFSNHMFTTNKDVDRMVSVLKEILV